MRRPETGDIVRPGCNDDLLRTYVGGKAISGTGERCITNLCRYHSCIITPLAVYATVRTLCTAFHFIPPEPHTDQLRVIANHKLAIT